jgi:hypothetical protein
MWPMLITTLQPNERMIEGDALHAADNVLYYVPRPYFEVITMFRFLF